ncbi:MAG: RagB/SusD family nutrient uptake outer membrane protein [Fermentimonas sp.]|jgi:hypothetical protein
MKSKNIILTFLLSCIFLLNACIDLDLNPLSEGSSENWYSSEEELQMATAYIFHTSIWKRHSPADFFWHTDDFSYRTNLGVINGSTLTGSTGIVTAAWNDAYNCIANANQILVNSSRASENLTEEKLNFYRANAKFARAAQYSKLIFLFGDVPYYTTVLNVDEAFSMGRTNKEAILDSIYADFDFATQFLPEIYGTNEYHFATKGAAYAMKARIALYMGDYITARNAAKACIDLGIYKLFPKYSTLFLQTTKNSCETIFCIANSVSLKSKWSLGPKSYIVRTAGGFGSATPSWELLCSYLCTDGLPIDESPLFDPRNPFKNRDPRCTATIVEFGTNWLGYKFEVHPDTLKVMNYNTGDLVPNTQNRAVDQWATYNGLMLKKFLDESMLGSFEAENDQIIMRYADVLLMYAEAKIELGEIDETVLNAINQVRARAYEVDVNATSDYPAVTTVNQSELRKALRIERRMEFAWENDLRYNDIIRWRLAEKVLNRPDYGMLDPQELRDKVVNKGLWFFPGIPEIDEDGTPDFTSLYNTGLIKLLAARKFEARQYLWPIPTSEMIINENLTQNPGY